MRYRDSDEAWVIVSLIVVAVSCLAVGFVFGLLTAQEMLR